jgi:hypothetical protein
VKTVSGRKRLLACEEPPLWLNTFGFDSWMKRQIYANGLQRITLKGDGE